MWSTMMTDTTGQECAYVQQSETVSNYHSNPCPSCGRCPTCGRGGPSWPVYPWNPPTYPTYPWNPFITWC